ncbi:MAG: GvpL/GvpF family gas vesicle protein [Anaerolineae bacterium]|nr:GvpL/GvpF family gas vesicle protein [Anaerolineae bacterium]
MAEAPGRYVYCIMPDTGKAEWGEIGVDGQAVYTIPYKDISALVHDCPLEPYQGDDETVKEWVWTHSQVVDAAWAEADSVLPMTFDCIISPAEGRTVEETVVAWLQAEYDGFKAKLEELRGKVELGVQIFWLVDAISEKIVEANKEIRQLRQEMEGKPKGMAYFYQQKIEKALKQALEAMADEDYRRYYRLITPYAEDVHVNKVKRPAEGKQMLMNLSLLVRKDRVKELGEELEKIEREKGLDVRFTGPWPPYSFVSRLITPEAES